MTVSPRLSVAIATGMLCIVLPLSLRAAPAGPGSGNAPRPGPIDPKGHVASPPSDTTAKADKAKGDKSSAPSSKKRLKGRQAAPATTTGPHQYLPDQPWETEFFVENDMAAPSPRSFLVLASARR